jgi:transposase
MTVEGALDAEVFRCDVREILLPTLCLKNAGVTMRFLPAYSPDLNLIELMWSKVKALLRKAEASTKEALLLVIGDARS